MTSTPRPPAFGNPELRFVEEASPAAFIAALTATGGTSLPRQILVLPGQANPGLLEGLAAEAGALGLSLFAPAGQNGLPVPPAGFRPEAVIMLEEDGDLLSGQLMQFLDKPPPLIVAPRTRHYWQRRSLYLISIPKGGTHLLYELAEAFGYRPGISCTHEPQPGHWYCVEYSNSHTVARDFFVDTVRRQAFGNRHHAFMRTPALFIYRNPLDILVSEANYYHKPGKTAFAGYLNHRSFADRLRVLLGEDWLLGSLRSRIGGFLPWLEFRNVAPISFEELVGSQGGGDDALQRRLIWSLQLKLHVPGTPADYAGKVFNTNSATFHAGTIGSFREKMPAGILRDFFRQPLDFMHTLGYMPERPAGFRRLISRLFAALAPGRLIDGEIARYPLRADEFRRRPLVCDGNDHAGTPIALELNYLGYNIIRFRGRFLGIPLRLGAIDLDEAGDFPAHPEIISDKTADWVKFRIQQRLEAREEIT